MGRFNKILLILLIILSLTISLIRPIGYGSRLVPEEILIDYHSLSDDSAVIITADIDFISQGWLGNGSKSNPFRIENLTITANTTCISISDTSSYFEIHDCVLTSTVDYVETMKLTNVQNGIISSNNLTFDLIGIDIEGCNSCVIESNDVHRPDLPEQSGIHAIRVNDSDNVIIARNQISSAPSDYSSSYNTGILVNTSIHCVIQENTVKPFMGRGIYLESSGYCDVIDNFCHECNLGYYIRGSNNCYLEGNLANWTNMGFGIWVGQSHILRDNVAEENFGEGYVIANSYDCQMIGNVVKDIYMDNGIEIIYGAANNILYENYILCENVLDDGSNNQWDNGIDVGNYWLSYSGTEPYTIPGTAGSVDRFPRQYIPPAINLVSIPEFEVGNEDRVLSWTYSGQHPTNYTLERRVNLQSFEIENKGVWNETITTLSLNIIPTEVGVYLYRLTVLYERGFSLVDETWVQILPASGPNIVVWTNLEYPTPDLDIGVNVHVYDISGVSTVILSYSTSSDSQWHNITMHMTLADLWTGSVPSQLNDTTVYLRAYANDTLGNWALANIIERLVTDSPPTPPPPTTPTTIDTHQGEGGILFTSVLIGGIVIEAIIIVYLLRNRFASKDWL